MKKSNLVTGIVYVLIGIECLFVAVLTNTKLDSLLFGLAGAGIGPGCVMICKYFYWTSPKHEKEYREKLKQQQIELHDELKEKLRDKSGRYAYILGLVTAAAAIPVLAVLMKLHLIENSLLLISFLFGYLILQYLAGVVIFRHLLKKYE